MILGSSFDPKRRYDDIGAIGVLRRGGRKFQGTVGRVIKLFTYRYGIISSCSTNQPFTFSKSIPIGALLVGPRITRIGKLQIMHSFDCFYWWCEKGALKFRKLRINSLGASVRFRDIRYRFSFAALYKLLYSILFFPDDRLERITGVTYFTEEGKDRCVLGNKHRR